MAGSHCGRHEEASSPDELSMDLAPEYRELVRPDLFCLNPNRNQCYPRSSLHSSTAATSPCKLPVGICGK